MHGIKAFRFGARQLHHACGNDLQAGVLEAGVNLADDILGHGIGFDNRQGTFNSHAAFSKQKLIKNGLAFYQALLALDAAFLRKG